MKAYTNSGKPTVFLTDSTISFAVQSRETSPLPAIDTFQRVDMHFAGTGAAAPQRPFKMGMNTGAGYLNYFLPHTPNGITNVNGYSRVVYKGIYNNVDMEAYSNGNGTKFYFVCASGSASTHGNPANILLNFAGADSIHIPSDSGLTIYTHLGSFHFTPGYAYEDSAGHIVPTTWKANFEKISANLVRFHTGSYNTNETLIIRVDRGHPQAAGGSLTGVTWSTYYEGNNTDILNDVTNDPAGNVYTAGTTSSNHFPVLNYYQGSNLGTNNATILKFNSGGVRQWATYYGGSTYDVANGIVTDASGNSYTTGQTLSSDFHTKPSVGATNQLALSGSSDAFIVKLDPTGQILLWATYYGGTGGEGANHAAMDGSGNLYIVGGGADGNTPQVTEGGAYNNTDVGQGFIAKFNSAGLQVWGTTIGTGSYTDATVLSGCAVDPSGDFFIVGTCGVTGYDVTAGLYSFVSGFPDADAIATGFNSSNAINWSTYYGGNGQDKGLAITADYNGNAYITGQTFSPYSGSGAHHDIELQSNGGTTYYVGTNGNGPGNLLNPNAFIAEFEAGDGTLLWGTYYGGNTATQGQAITIDQHFNLFVTGQTLGLIPLPGSNPAGMYNQTSFAGTGTINTNCFIAGFNQYNYVWGTYFGGNGGDIANGISQFGASKLYIIGSSGGAGYPTQNSGVANCWYEPTLTDPNGTDIISELDLTTIEGINNIPPPTGGEINVFPNPASQNITVQFELKETQNVDLILYNSLGQTVYNETLKGTQGRVSHQIDISLLSEGIYLLKVNEANTFLTKKVVKQN